MKHLVYFFLLFSFAAQAQQQPALPPAEARTLAFIPNQGQWPAAVRYAGTVPGGHLYLEPSGLHYVLLQPIRHPHLDGKNAPRLPAASSLIRGHQLRVRFVGADLATPLVPAEATGQVQNYLQGNDPAAWAHNVPSYRQVRYQAPWPGVGARFYENSRQQLEYDFEVAAGADAAQVQLRYDGASSLSLGDDGRLHVGTTLGELTELAPQAYQLDPRSGARQPVACHYRLRLADSTVTFALGRYDHRRPLVIDPTVQFSTYSGATGDNWGFTATYDAAGNIYSGGIVLANGLTPSYPTTPGAFQTTFAAVIDMAFIKYNPTVNGAASRVWATYVGGDFQDIPTSLVVNSNNELIILGTSASSNYPVTTTAYQRTFGGGTRADPFGFAATDSVYSFSRGTDIVVTRLSSDGSTLAASTYLGGTGTDGLVPYNRKLADRQLPQNYGDPFRGDVITDTQGNIYLASVTASTNFPVTSSSFGPTYRGGTCDAVVVKMPASLSALTWSGYLGGNAADAAYSLQLDASSNVYVAGGTLSPNFPATAGALTTTAQGDVDGFVARIAANGSAIQKATYLGTSAYDQAFFVQLGGDGGVYLLGQSQGAWPVSAGLYSNPNSHQFIQKLSADLNQSLLSTVFGSGRSTIDISPTAFLVDQCDRVYVCGWGGMVNQYQYNTLAYDFNGYTDGLPTTPNAVRTAPDVPTEGSDFYLAQFSPGLTSLLYGTYYGDATPYSEGDHVDGGTSRFDPRGVVYSAVCSCFDPAGFPVPPGANTYSAVNGTGGTNCNNAAFKLNFEPTSAQVGPDRSVCLSGSPLALTGGSPSGGTYSGPGVSGSVATGFVFTPSAALLGVQTLTYTVVGATAACTATAQLRVTVVAVPQAVAAALPPVCATGQALPLAGGSPSGGVWSGPGVSGSPTTGYVFTPVAALVGTQTLTYTLAGTSSCGPYQSQATATVQVLPVFTATVSADSTLCPGSGPVRLRGLPAGGVWSGPGVVGNVFTPGAPGTVVLTYTVGGSSPCASSATRRFTVLAAPVLAPALVPAPCIPSAVAPLTVHYTQSTATVPAGAVLTWHFGDGSPDVTGPDVTHTYTQAGTFQPTVTASYNQTACSQSAPLTPVVVKAFFIPNIITPNGDQKNDFFVPLLGGCPPRLQVFSRWGQPVYEDSAYRNTWRAEGLDAGTYYYLITPVDGSPTLKGWVQVVKQ
ncbi:MAG: gliding motility-associated C-terminal domain-containing protein [Janthinobacterium lividum]